VVCLETEFFVGVIRSQLLQTVGEFAALDHPTPAIGRLPKAVDRHEQLARIVARSASSLARL